MTSHTALLHTPRELDVPVGLRQLRDGTVVITGGTNGEMEDRSLGETDEEIERVIQTARRYAPALQTAVIRDVRRSRRPIPQDGQTILGFSDTVANLYVAVTHSGVTLAALIEDKNFKSRFRSSHWRTTFQTSARWCV